MYSSYDQYCLTGGKLSAGDYTVLAKEAAYMIDHATMGQAQSAPDSMSEALADCECALIRALEGGSFQTGTVQSFTNDGYSETRMSGTESKAALRGLMARYLTQPVNLLAVSGRSFV